MQWDASPGAGFTSGRPWLPLVDQAERNVAAQAREDGSTLSYWRRLIHLRSELAGALEWVDLDEHALAFRRGPHTIAISFADEPLPLPGGRSAPRKRGFHRALAPAARGRGNPQRVGIDLNEAPGNRVVCLGEALVDFLSESPVARLTDARAFVPSFGGSQANIAVGAARFGARSAMVGRAGTDPWGAWLRARLESEGVDVSLFELRDDAATAMAFVALSSEGEPTFSIHGGAEEGGPSAPCSTASRKPSGSRLGAGPPGVLVFGSDTLIVPADRDLLAPLKRAAVAGGWQVLYDPNLRHGRWGGETEMLGVTRAALNDVTVVKANAAEAAALTGEADVGRAAEALVRLGPRQALVTAGDDGAVLAGPEGVVRVPAEDVDVVDTIGAGDAVAGVLAAGLARSGEVTPRFAEVAMRVAARVVAVRGALTGLPAAAEGRDLLA